MFVYTKNEKYTLLRSGYEYCGPSTAELSWCEKKRDWVKADSVPFRFDRPNCRKKG